MKSRRVFLWLVFFLLACTTSSLAGGGFALPGVGSKALDLGGAFRGLADDWSAAFWNPAGLAYLPQSEFTMNFYTLNFRPQYTPHISEGEGGYSYSFGYLAEKYYPDDRAFFLPSFSGFHKFPQIEGLTAGVAFFVPYKLETQWNLYEPPPGFDNDMPYPKFDHRTDILIWDLHPTVAKSFMEDKLSLGLGISIQRADFELRRTVLIPVSTLPRPYDYWPEDAHLNTDGWGLGFNAGVLYKASPKLQLGLSYQSPVDISLSGDLELELYWPVIPGSQIPGGTTYYKDGKYEATLPLPGEIGLGIMYKPLERLTLTSDVSSTNWSRMESLDITDMTLVPSQHDTIYVALMSSTLPFNWKNTTKFSLGAEYALREDLFLRGGYSFEESPIPDNTFTVLIPDVGNKNSVNLGLSYQVNSFEFGYDFQMTIYQTRDIQTLQDVNNDDRFDNMPGQYKMLFFCSGLSFTYGF
jgi:long-chain fatty acid transport protein